MITIWNKTFQSLLLSGDVPSIRLALKLIHNVEDVCHWWFCSDEEAERYGLEEIKLDKAGYILDSELDKYEELRTASRMDNGEYIKKLYRRQYKLKRR